MSKITKVAAAVVMAAGLTLTFQRGGAPAIAQSDSFSEGQVKSIEKIVKDYLVAHPELLLEMRDAYEKKAEAERSETTRARMPEFYSSLSSMKKDLGPLSVGDGDVTVVEFFDYNCGYCRQALPEVVKLIDSDKRVKVQFMEFPILAPGSTEASKVAIAAAKQGKYLEFHKAMFGAGRASKETALKVAEQLGLDMEKVKADSASPETEALIAKISELGKRVFIDGTPTFIIGEKTNPGAIDYDQLKQSVEEIRKDGCKACESATPAGAKDEKKS